MSEMSNPFDDSSQNEDQNVSKESDAILPQQNYLTNDRPRMRKHSLFWPIALIGFGVLLLLSNLGYIPSTGWAVLWRFWPIALIALGLDVAIGRRTTGGAIASAILILLLVGLAIGAALFAEQIPILVELTKPAVLKYEHVDHPMNDIETARVSIDWTSSPGALSALEDSNNLIEADVAFRGELIFNVTQTKQNAVVTLNSYLQGVSYGVFTFDDPEARWDVGLNPKVEYDLILDVGSGSCDFDLTELELDHLEIDGGSGSVTISLPDDSFLGSIDGGSGSITMIVPDDVGLELEIDRGSGGLRLNDTFVFISGDEDDYGIWRTEGYDNAEVQLSIEVDQGSGSLLVR
jgi:hypothetical protein